MLAALSEARPVELMVPVLSMPMELSMAQPAELVAPLPSIPAGLNFAERSVSNSH